MSAAIDPPRRMTYEEYCRSEMTSEVRHDFNAGELIAMAAGSIPHGQICMNLAHEIGVRLKGSPCQPFGSDNCIAFPGKTYTHYPDLGIVCGELILDPRDPSEQNYINPTVVIELPLREIYDRVTFPPPEEFTAQT
jgi:Uma2 family endonuclease